MVIYSKSLSTSKALKILGKRAIEVVENKGKSYKNLKKMKKSLSTDTKKYFLQKSLIFQGDLR